MTPTPSDRVVLVAAVADNGVIGVGGRLPWHLPDDLAHFRRVTTGHVVVMGRRTFESIGRPLPRRTNVVVTRDPGWTAEGVLVAHSLDEALALARAHQGDVMVVGGGEIYAAAMPLAGRQILTRVHQRPDGDAFYPAVDDDAWEETGRERGEGFDVVWLRRRVAATPPAPPGR